MDIVLPHQFTPRDYQLPVLKALDQGYKRVLQRWHRRSGKDKVDFNYMIKKAAEVPGNYYYFAPNYEQGRKIIWDNIDNSGFKMIHHVPKELIKRIDNTRMQIEFAKSLIQVIGTDDVNRIVGTNPKGCVWTEYPLHNPAAWDYIAPILLANGGWSIFNFTPRGKNHAYQLEEYAKKHPEEWFISVLSADDTHILDEKMLQTERERLFEKYNDDSLYFQEYFVSYTVAVQGAYYGSWLQRAEEEKRITNVPIDDTIPVDTYWDLGVGDATAIWFIQRCGTEIHVVDYLEASGEGLNYYIKCLQDKHYLYGEHIAPHDIEVRELTSGKSRKEIASSLGINFSIAPHLPLEDGINAVRGLLNRCWFDEERCQRGINALRSYQKEYDEKNADYKNHPLHDWSSHGADAFRYFAVSYQNYIDTTDIPDDTESMSGFY